MKRLICFVLMLTLLSVPLVGCTMGADSGKESPQASQAATKTVHGVINKIDNYLVLVTEDGEYQVMDFGEGVTLDDYAEGDTVDVTYTGELGVEDANPVITAIAKSK